MRIKEVQVSYAATVNLGNYESMKLSAHLTADIDEDEDDLDDCFTELYKECKRQVEGRLKKFRER